MLFPGMCVPSSQSPSPLHPPHPQPLTTQRSPPSPLPPAPPPRDLGEEIRSIGHEYGTTTGRPRRVGWLDMVALRYVSRINGLTHINLTKLDVLDSLEEIKVGGPGWLGWPGRLSGLEGWRAEACVFA